MKRLPALLVALVALCLAPLALADTVAEKFARGKLEFEYNNFGNAIKILRPLLHPVVQLSTEEDVVRAYEMLGLSNFYIGKQDQAREEFTNLLYVRPRHRMDAFLVPPAAVSFYDKIWNHPEMKEKLEKIERERRAKEERETKQDPPPKTVLTQHYFQRAEEHHSRVLAFLPFGIGQYQNDHQTKFWLMLSVQGAALLTNMVSYLMLEGLANANGRFDASDLELARGMRMTAWVSLGVFAAAYVYGAIDANVYFRPVTTGDYLKMDEKQFQEADLPKLSPMAFEGGGGLSFQTRF